MNDQQINQLVHKIHQLEQKNLELKRQNAQLRERANLADSSSQAKSDFLAMISHEIRTPMNGVLGLSELLLETPLEERQKQFAQLILSSARNLLTLLDRLLDFSKVEADKMVLNIQPFSLRELIDDILSLYKVAGKRKGLNVRLEFDPLLDRLFLGDAHRICQVLVNLLGNAIKFTDRGEVVIRVVSVQGEDGSIRFSISDTGPGIPREEHSRLFVPFSQIETSAKRQYTGTGLGLVISERLIDLMEGNIGYETTVGKGSCFWFELPLPEAVGEDDIFEDEVVDLNANQCIDSDQQAKVLIVDDDEVNRMVLTEIFSKTDALVSTVDNGMQAVETCKNDSFDLILMDCRMPVLNGFEATSQIRKFICKQSRKTVIIALTADVTRETEKKCLAVGMDGYLVKPLETSQLQKILNVHLSRFQLSIVSHGERNGQKIGEKKNKDVIINQESLGKLRHNLGDITLVVKVFLDVLPHRLKELEQAVHRRDFKRVVNIAHRIKGSGSQFGAELLSKLCTEIETMAKNEHACKLQQQYDKIFKVVEQIITILSEELA